MASKTIMIEEEVYNTLKELKRNRSFSEYLRYLLKNVNQPPISSFGVLKGDEDPFDYKEIKKERRDRNVTI
ncbi:MAG: antitoxin VapB family protein [Candidatus Kariarchaeaceae archaeon]|jgi:predicted CopG family antitoxin